MAWRWISCICKLEQSRFYTFQEVIIKYGSVIDFVMYHSLTASIPAMWKIILKDRKMGDPSEMGLTKLVQAKASVQRSTGLW